MESILHICTRQDWEAAQADGMYRHPSLDQAGFIHCSQPEQILEVANRYYRGESGLVILWIDPHKVIADVRWETADEGLFPHIYGPLNLDAVLAVQDFSPEADGVFRTLPARGD